jgi:hypothetical protein
MLKERPDAWYKLFQASLRSAPLLVSGTQGKLNGRMLDLPSLCCISLNYLRPGTVSSQESLEYMTEAWSLGIIPGMSLG